MEKSYEAYRKKFDISDYIGEGNTIYDFIDKYIEIGDYSLENIMNHIREQADATGVNLPNDTAISMRRIYVENFENLTNELNEATFTKPGTTSKNGVQGMTREEKEKLLEELRNAAPDVPQFDSISKYISYAKANLFNDAYYSNKYRPGKDVDTGLDAINKILVKHSAEHASPTTKARAKHKIINGIYCKYIKHYINSTTPYKLNRGGSEKPDPLQDPEWWEASAIDQATGSFSDFLQYEKYLEKHLEKVKEFERKQAIKTRCEIKRSRYVNSEVSKTLSSEQKARLNFESMEDVLYEKPDRKPAKKGTFKWQVDEYETPQLLFDAKAEYSENGIENQRVIAVSYGKLKYGTLFNPKGDATMTSELMEIVGVTRVGKDGAQNYFVAVPLSNADFKKTSEISNEEQVVPFKVNGEKRLLFDMKTFDEYNLVRKDKIPESEIPFFAKVAFSDKNLTDAIERNYRFAGTVSKENGRLGLDTSYTRNAYDLEALHYALDNEGKINSHRCDNLRKYLQSTRLLTKQIKIIEEIDTQKGKSKIPDDQGENR